MSSRSNFKGQGRISILAFKDDNSLKEGQSSEHSASDMSARSSSSFDSSSAEDSEGPQPSTARSSEPNRGSKKRHATENDKKSKKKMKKHGKSRNANKISGNDQVISDLRDILSKISIPPTKAPDPLESLPPSQSSQHDQETTNSSNSNQNLLQALLQVVEKGKEKPKVIAEPGSKIEFKRLDQVWDHDIHNWQLKETADADRERDEWDQYVFTVRRQFDIESKFFNTFVDVKSKHLKDSIHKVMGDVKGINIYSESPCIQPDMLFLFLEEFRQLKEALRAEVKDNGEKKARKLARLKARHLNVLIKYLDEDYAEKKKTIYPMLKAGHVSYEYLWALFKPNTIAFTSTYGDEEEPRAFKIEESMDRRTMSGAKYYIVQGRYLDYDGKAFGMAMIAEEIGQFQGARRISSLPCYPIQYHRTAEQIKSQLIERGKKFVTLQGSFYKGYNGLAYVKQKVDSTMQVLKVDVRGRIMVDPKTFRRFNANYQLSSVTGSMTDDEDDYNDAVMDSGSNTLGQRTPTYDDSKGQKQFKVIKDDNGECKIVQVNLSEELNKLPDSLEDKVSTSEIFSEEQFIITNPVVLGFSFADKIWAEFAVSRLSEVQWNDGAFDSLILPDNQKSIVKALVSSHVFHPSRSIDDVIAGKGKGLVATLHGPPGVGKTLTAEGIADLLRRPLYTVSAGDLGINAKTLEKEFQMVLDVAHSWGAILLLDEADVFLEARSVHDIHRNALVSIFLRLLEYFQGILFLTTNRVQVFDDAFVSRIHLSLKYDELSPKAKKAVWKTFIGKVANSEDMEVEVIKEAEFDALSRRNVNGRQIKNIVRAAQALAISENTPLSMAHIKTVMEVAQSFERDLKGGTGYEDAMRGYT